MQREPLAWLRLSSDDFRLRRLVRAPRRNGRVAFQ